MPILVLVTETELRRAESTFTSTPGFDCRPAPRAEEALCDEVVRQGARAVIVGSGMYRDRLYTTLGPGGVLARFGVGYDNVDLPRATAAGVLCTNTPDVLQQSVAEITITMIGAAARHVLAVATDRYITGDRHVALMTIDEMVAALEGLSFQANVRNLPSDREAPNYAVLMSKVANGHS